MSQHRPSLRAISTILFGALLFAACSGGDSSQSSAAVSSRVMVTATPNEGIVGQTFMLTASVEPASSNLAITWEDPIGNVLGTGPTLAFQPTTDGWHTVTARAAANGNEVAVGGTALIVFPNSSQSGLASGAGITGEVRLGDVDGDGAVTLRDSAALAQVLDTGVYSSLTEANLDAADIDADDALTETDLLLLQETLLEGAASPAIVLPALAHPGTLVRVFHPALLDPLASPTLGFGSLPPVGVFRPRLGVVNAFVPLSLSAQVPGDGSPVETPIVILLDGVQVATLTMSLARTPEHPTLTPREALSAYGDALLGATTTLSADAVTSLNGLVGLDATQAAAVGALGDTVAALLTDVGFEMMSLAASASEPDAAALWSLFAANGAIENLQTLQELPLTSAEGLPPGFGRVLVSLLCSLRELQNSLTTPLLVTTAICAGVGAIAIAFPITAAVTGPIAVLCTKVLTAAAALQLILAIVPPPPPWLLVTATPSTLSSGQSAQITVNAPIQIGSSICSGLWTFAVGRLSKITGKLVSNLAGSRQHAWQVAQSWPTSSASGSGVAGNLRQEIEQLIEDFYGNAVGVATGIGAIAATIEGVQTMVCDQLRTGSALVPIELGVTLSPVPDPSNAGTLTIPPLGTLDPATFTCDPNMTGTGEVRVRFDAFFCSGIKGQAEIRCQPGGEEATICFGDNGNLLDDIYELQIDGVTVLAPSAPVVNVCHTAELSIGNHTATLIGRAAPDGIGTYFISFGAPITNVSGPPLSGTNLVAGAIFTWNFEIPEPNP